MPATARDARAPAAGLSPGGRIEAARKFKKFVDHDFSKMTDTKGGFLSVEDDPFNKAFQGEEKGEKRPEHVSLKEWERLRLIRELRRRKEGPFEPGLSVLAGEEQRKRCRECGSKEIDWVWEEVFGTRVCGGCKEKFPEKYSLLTKTEVKDDYLLTDRKSSTLLLQGQGDASGE
jgi:DNA-repair protein complementing XP-A cells